MSRLRDPDFDRSDKVEVPLTKTQIVALARLCRQARRKAERKAATSTFVPEPGKRNASESSAEAWGNLERLLFEIGDA